MLSPLLPPIHHLHFKNHQNVPRTDVPRTAFGVQTKIGWGTPDHPVTSNLRVQTKIGWGTPDHPVTSNLKNFKES